MATATETTVTVTFDPTAINKQADVLFPATLTSAGVLSAELYAEILALIGGLSFLQVFTDLTRPPANDPALGAVTGVKTAVIWNSSDNQPNYSNGIDWYDASGNLT